MDFQALILVNLTEQGRREFDPSEENKYYEAIADLPKLVLGTRLAINWVMAGLSVIRPVWVRPLNREGTEKAMNG